MKLTYRGIEYEYIPLAVEVSAEEVSGKYRGAEWKRHRSRYTTVNENAVEYKYRGATYYSGNPEEIEKLKQRQKLNFIFAASKNLFPRNEVNYDGLAQTRLANLCRNLQHRLEVAKLSGDENLIQMLEDEANQLSVTNCQLSFKDC
ncbi:MAG: DUF4278 domain-containing protein [Cyanobacteria bacterium P01_D01_bin.50]